VPFAGEVAWLEWWTKSSARELLLGSGVGSARAELRRNSCSRRRRGNPVPRPRQQLQTDYPLFPKRFGDATLKPALPTAPPGWDVPVHGLWEGRLPRTGPPNPAALPRRPTAKLVVSCRSPRQRRRIPSYSVVLSFTPVTPYSRKFGVATRTPFLPTAGIRNVSCTEFPVPSASTVLALPIDPLGTNNSG